MYSPKAVQMHGWAFRAAKESTQPLATLNSILSLSVTTLSVTVSAGACIVSQVF